MRDLQKMGKGLKRLISVRGTGESMTRVDPLVSLMHHDPDRSWITDPNPDHPKGTQPKFPNCGYEVRAVISNFAAKFST